MGRAATKSWAAQPQTQSGRLPPSIVQAYLHSVASRLCKQWQELRRSSCLLQQCLKQLGRAGVHVQLQ